MAKAESARESIGRSRQDHGDSLQKKIDHALLFCGLLDEVNQDHSFVVA